MMRGIIFGNFMPLLLLARVLPFIFISTMVILTVIFWVIYGIKKYKWAKITAIVLSSVLGLLFLGGIAMTICRGFVPFGNTMHGRGMFNNFSGFKHGIRRF
jgi:uncharacterized membrane protein YqjE